MTHRPGKSRITVTCAQIAPAWPTLELEPKLRLKLKLEPKLGAELEIDRAHVAWPPRLWERRLPAINQLAGRNRPAGRTDGRRDRRPQGGRFRPEWRPPTRAPPPALAMGVGRADGGQIGRRAGATRRCNSGAQSVRVLTWSSPLRLASLAADPISGGGGGGRAERLLESETLLLQLGGQKWKLIDLLHPLQIKSRAEEAKYCSRPLSAPSVVAAAAALAAAAAAAAAATPAATNGRELCGGSPRHDNVVCPCCP